MMLDIGFGYEPCAAFASQPENSRGRLQEEKPSPTRSDFQRDRDRIIHSNAFRRLKHKTQVFIAHEGDHYRTRLTHSIEVAQIARALARALRLNEELAEAIALAHDFGHPPFGHAGEEALARCMTPYGGFDHNAQSLHIVTCLEQRYGEFDGLNLSWETLEGLVKHNGPLKGPHAKTKTIPYHISRFNAQFDLELEHFAGLEAQCAAIADDIAYNAHDVDDGLRAGLLSLDRLREVELTAGLMRSIEGQYPRLEQSRFAHELVRRQITLMVEDVIAEALSRLNILSPQNVEDIYQASRPMLAFSAAIEPQEKQLKSFLFDHLYFHESVMVRRQAGEEIIAQLFDVYMQDLSLLPPEWALQGQGRGQGQGQGQTEMAQARLVADFLAGMTDTYALRDYKRLFGALPSSFSCP